MTGAHFMDWKPVGIEQARRALMAGGTLFSLPSGFGNGAACYAHGLQTKRGTCYIVSDRVMKSLKGAS